MDRNNQPLMQDDQWLMDVDDGDREIAEVYLNVAAKQEALRQRRVAEGRAGFTDLDAAGQRAYVLDRQRECRSRQRAHEDSTGFAPLSTEAIRGSVLDAAMLLIAAGDERAQVILDLAAKAFEVPEVAALAISSKARAHRRSRKKSLTLTEARLNRAA